MLSNSLHFSFIVNTTDPLNTVSLEKTKKRKVVQKLDAVCKGVVTLYFQTHVYGYIQMRVGLYLNLYKL